MREGSKVANATNGYAVPGSSGVRCVEQAVQGYLKAG
jgi:hypothetical protein